MSYDYLTYKVPREDRACIDCGYVRKTKIYGTTTGGEPWWKTLYTICEKKRSIRRHQRTIQNLQSQVLDLQIARARRLKKGEKK